METLVHKTPVNAQAGNEAGGGITGGCKIVVGKAEAVPDIRGVQILKAQIGFEAPDTEMHIGINTGQVADGYRILVEELP